MLLGSVNAFLGQTLTGYKDVSRRAVITNFVGTPLNMILVIALIAAGSGLRGYIVAQVWSAFVVLVLLAIAVWRTAHSTSAPVNGSPASLSKGVASFAGATMSMELLGFLLSQGDKVMIGIFLNARHLGLYAVAGALVSFVPVVLQAINQIFAPTIADLYATGQIALLSRLFHLHLSRSMRINCFLSQFHASIRA
jgi:O-antigen/teichoic acid export membrane protein